MKLLEVKDIALILSVKPSTVYQWAELGQMPSIKLNGSLRFDVEDVMHWIKSCKKAAESSYNPLTQARSPRKGGRN